MMKTFQTLMLLAAAIFGQLTVPIVSAQSSAGDESLNKIENYKQAMAKRVPSESSSVTAPSNDNFANAQLINSQQISMIATNSGATGEAGEPFHGAGHGAESQAQNNSIWYKYTPSAVPFVVTISTSSTDPVSLNDTVLSVYTGSAVNALTPIAESDDYPGLNLHSKVTFTAHVGQTYYIAIDGWGPSTGSFALHFRTDATPPNDNFANAEDVTITGSNPSVPITGTNYQGTSEPGEPVHAPTGGGFNNSVWFKWTAQQSRGVTFTLAGSAFDTVLAVYTGTAVDALTLVARNDDFGPSGTLTSQVSFAATAGVTYEFAIDGYSNNSGNLRLSWNKNFDESGRRLDFDGNQQSEISVFRPSNGQWWISYGNAGVAAYTFGTAADRPTPADFTGDGKVDVAVFRPATGEWFILRSEDSSFYSVPFGTSGDFPMPGKFDNDQAADIAVFRPSTATWYIRRSRSLTVRIEQFGLPGDIPVAADYDGDGQSDIAIFRPTNGQWWLSRSTAGVIAATFGMANDKPTVADYTGDGRADIAFFRPSSGEWFTLRSEDYSYYSLPFGISSDLPAPADYNGDGKTDYTVFRWSTGAWYVNYAGGGGTYITNFGVSGDRPTANSYIP